MLKSLPSSEDSPATRREYAENRIRLILSQSTSLDALCVAVDKLAGPVSQHKKCLAVVAFLDPKGEKRLHAETVRKWINGQKPDFVTIWPLMLWSVTCDLSHNEAGAVFDAIEASV